MIKHLFFALAAVGSQGNRSPLSSYQNPFVRCEAAVSQSYVNMVSKKSIVIEIGGLFYAHAVQSYATLTEERVLKLIATAVKSAWYKFVPSALVSLPRT